MTSWCHYPLENRSRDYREASLIKPLMEEQWRHVSCRGWTHAILVRVWLDPAFALANYAKGVVLEIPSILKCLQKKIQQFFQGVEPAGIHSGWLRFNLACCYSAAAVQICNKVESQSVVEPVLSTPAFAIQISDSIFWKSGLIPT